MWYCRFHFLSKSGDNDAITADIRRNIRDGEPLDHVGPTPTVVAMREKLKDRRA